MLALTVVRAKVEGGVLRSMQICCDSRRLMMSMVAGHARVFNWQWQFGSRQPKGLASNEREQVGEVILVNVQVAQEQ